MEELPLQSPARTATACRRCHSRKVKCTASQGLPCLNCSSAGTECILIDSRRGKYPRRSAQKSAPSKSRRSGRRTQAFDSHQSGVPPVDPAAYPPGLAQVGSGSTPGPGSLEDAPSSRSAVQGHPSTRSDPRSFAGLVSNETDGDSPGDLYARIAESSVNKDQPTITGTTETTFLGEAFSLTYVVHHIMEPLLSNGDPQALSRRLHFPLTHGGYGGASRNVPSRGDIVQSQTRHLQEQRLLYLPPQTVLRKLLDCFFTLFHPAFPILDPESFTEAVFAGEASLLVLSALLMIAVTICSEDTLQQNGLISRYGARSIYYHQAKVLYDAGLEPDKMDNIAAVFYMSFWWGGPDEQKDSWHWLGIASSMASSLGMHRSTKNSSVDYSTARKWKRIWWSIKIREALVSASIGRPRHIADMDCDIELPIRDDVKCVIQGEQEDCMIYFVQMAKLSQTFSTILASRYAASRIGRSARNQEELELELDIFCREVPNALLYRTLKADGAGLWAAMLQVAINYATILLCRPVGSGSKSSSGTAWGNESKATAAANETTRITEDILSSSSGRICQIHTIPALFNSLAIHLRQLCSPSKITRGLAESRSDVCMLGLGVLQESWPVGGWVHRLFVTIRDILGRRLGDSSNEGLSVDTQRHGELNLAHPIPERETMLQAQGFGGSDPSGPGEAHDGHQAWPPTSHRPMEVSSLHRNLELEAQELALEDCFPDMFAFGQLQTGDLSGFL